MPLMPVPPTPPSRSMSPAAFIAAADAWLAWEQAFATWAGGLGTPGLGGGAMTGDLALAPEVTVASAATTDIGAANSNFVAVSGSATITSLGTMTNRMKFVRFTGAPLLTYNSTSLVLPGGANIQTAVGDEAIFASDGSGNWRCLSYQPVAGLSPVVTVSSWTPTVTFVTPGSLTVVYSTQTGSQVLISSPLGNLVLLNFAIVTSTFTFTGASGNFEIGGFPTPPQGGAQIIQSVASGLGTWSGLTGLTSPPSVNFNNAGTFLLLSFGTNSSANVTASNFTTATNITLKGNIVYRA